MMKMLIFSVMLFITSLFILLFSMMSLLTNTELMMEWNIVMINSMKMNMILVLNYKTLLYIFLVMFISSMIFMYSIEYMEVENFLLKRFYYLMMMFLMSMILLIISPNMLTIILGWDMLGLTSYCLIIYYSKMKSYNSGMMTIILNRIGDVSLLMIISMMSMFGSWNLLMYKMNKLMMVMIMIMVFTKSAQFPFFVWLPMAMMAPTPVSSLVHSSTLVTAGVYLMIWYNEMIDLKYMEFILTISSITMFFSGMMANFEMDFKKIIAFSTLSQLGFMMSILSMGLNELAFLHLFIHALFKSMMFMCVGSFIHNMKGIQNFRFYSGMFYVYSIKSSVIIMSLMMLCGFPFLVGFYSKDLMIEMFMFNKINTFNFVVLMISTMVTISYSFRIIMKLISNNYMMNTMIKKESSIMSFIMVFMMVFMLLMSKMIFNFNSISFNYNLMKTYKYFIIKMFILGFLLNIIINNYIYNSMIKIMINYFYMMNMFKLFKKNYIINLINYEMNYEKMFNEVFLSNIMMIMSMLSNKIMKKMMISIYSLMFFYIYLIMILFMF
uniref:NADH dehydrogenase subunit 5 n=1 Tax=Tetragonula iridipennis TaxID=597212 RepID=UPI0026E129E1|nr:NADH dehydrogenase subunit 5 [Tetragonula iridipennis]WJQ22761.1 NADH dehydrogenase subunit 5 [Tetragonula iridipennis]